jgi:uncharacterized protein (TIGR04255 family)
MQNFLHREKTATDEFKRLPRRVFFIPLDASLSLVFHRLVDKLMTYDPSLPEHPSMSRPTVINVGFELVFSGSAHMSEVLPLLRERLSLAYPKAHKRGSGPSAQQSDDAGQVNMQANLPNDEPHIRFQDEDELLSVYLGPNFFGFAALYSYQNWKVWREELTNLLMLLHELLNIQAYIRANLVFMNRIPWKDGELRRILMPWILPGVPPIPDVSDITGNQSMFNIQFPDGQQSIFIAYPILENDNTLIQLDLQHTIEFTDFQAASPSDLLEWIDFAHERIYQSYVSILTKEFMEERK